MATMRRSGLIAGLVTVLAVILGSCGQPVSYDLILRGGTIYDGSGAAAFIGDVAIPHSPTTVICMVICMGGGSELDGIYPLDRSHHNASPLMCMGGRLAVSCMGGWQ